jgi:stress-induced morphogen
MNSIQTKIEDLLKSAFPGELVNVQNESFKHSVPKGSETHFLVHIVSHQFEGKNLLKRHRVVQEILKEMTPIFKALSLHTQTPAESSTQDKSNIKSPNCKGAE